MPDDRLNLSDAPPPSDAEQGTLQLLTPNKRVDYWARRINAAWGTARDKFF